MGGETVAIDFAPFRAVSELLYGGPIVAERLAGIRDFVSQHADAMHPVTRRIIEGGARHLGVDAYQALHHLQALGVRTLKTWEVAECLFVPTTGTTYTIAEVEAEPIRLSANLGVYTNFVNLLDLWAIAVPAGFDSGGLPVGATLIAPCFSEMVLIGIDAPVFPWAQAVAAARTDLTGLGAEARVDPSAVRLGESLNHSRAGSASCPDGWQTTAALSRSTPAVPRCVPRWPASSP